jgi:hypothetical protein
MNTWYPPIFSAAACAESAAVPGCSTAAQGGSKMAVAVETRRLLIAIALLLFIFGVATGAASREQIAASKAAAIERFNAWCESNGVLSSKLTTVWSPAFGFHVKMNDRCEKGEIAMLVPDKMVFGPHLVSLAPPEMQPFIANMTEFDRRAVLLILERRNTSSFWKPYLDMLPALGDFDMPMLWTPELINELPSHHNEIAERAKKTMFRHEDASGRRGGYAHMKQFVLDEYPLLFPADVFTPESYIWAHMIFHTRAFAGRHGESVLVPVLDLLNHHPNSRQTHVMQGRNDDNIVQCDRVYLPGEESFNFYGFKGDSKLLHNYGYVHAPHVANPFNNVPFKLQLGVEPGIISGLKRNLLLDMSLNPDLLIFNLRKGALPPTLMTYMLISVCTDTDGEKVLRYVDRMCLRCHHSLPAKTH